jgi:hypothetical protein
MTDQPVSVPITDSDETANLKAEIDRLRASERTLIMQVAQQSESIAALRILMQDADDAAALEEERLNAQIDSLRAELMAVPGSTSVHTLVQAIAMPEDRRRADAELGSSLFSGWQVLHIGVDLSMRRVVTLHRPPVAPPPPKPTAHVAVQSYASRLFRGPEEAVAQAPAARTVSGRIISDLDSAAGPVPLSNAVKTYAAAILSNPDLSPDERQALLNEQAFANVQQRDLERRAGSAPQFRSLIPLEMSR